MKLASIAFRNLGRNKLRTTLTVLAGAVAIVFFVGLRTVLTSWSAAADFATKDRIATRHKVSFILQMPRRYADDLRTVPGVKQASFATWFGGKNPKNPDQFFATMAVESATFLDVMDEVVVSPEDKQRWLADKKGALIGDVLAKQLGLKVGDRFTLQGAIYPGDWEFNISGIYTAARKTVDRSTFWFHWSYLNDGVPEARKDQIGWIATRIDDAGRSAEISAAIDKLFDEKDVQTATMSERAMNLSFMGMLSAMLRALDVISLVMLLIMLLIIGNTIAMAVRERTREYGVLRALGFQPGHVRMFVIGEAMVLGLVTAVVGLAISYPFVELMIGRALEEYMGVWFPYFRIDQRTYVLATVLGLALAAVASIIPALRAGRLSVTDSLRRVA
jgi:putative ABC transport system permease protein